MIALLLIAAALVDANFLPSWLRHKQPQPSAAPVAAPKPHGYNPRDLRHQIDAIASKAAAAHGGKFKAQGNSNGLRGVGCCVTAVVGDPYNVTFCQIQHPTACAELALDANFTGTHLRTPAFPNTSDFRLCQAETDGAADQRLAGVQSVDDDRQRSG